MKLPCLDCGKPHEQTESCSPKKRRSEMDEKERWSRILDPEGLWPNLSWRNEVVNRLIEAGCKLPLEEESTPTEKVKLLIEAGWTISEDAQPHTTYYTSPDGYYAYSIDRAYAKAFQKKKKRVEVDVWRHKPTGLVRSIGDMWTYPVDDKGNWIKGKAVFEVEE